MCDIVRPSVTCSVMQIWGLLGDSGGACYKVKGYDSSPSCTLPVITTQYRVSITRHVYISLIVQKLNHPVTPCPRLLQDSNLRQAPSYSVLQPVRPLPAAVSDTTRPAASPRLPVALARYRTGLVPSSASSRSQLRPVSRYRHVHPIISRRRTINLASLVLLSLLSSSSSLSLSYSASHPYSLIKCQSACCPPVAHTQQPRAQLPPARPSSHAPARSPRICRQPGRALIFKAERR
jgi:hypothetical protein